VNEPLYKGIPLTEIAIEDIAWTDERNYERTDL